MKTNPFLTMLIQKGGAVYILTNKLFTVLYIGATSDLQRRIIEHKTGKYSNSFTQRYSCTVLVWYELHEQVASAFDHEKRLKGGNRAAKIRLIKAMNPGWRDLWEDVKNW